MESTMQSGLELGFRASRTRDLPPQKPVRTIQKVIIHPPPPPPSKQFQDLHSPARYDLITRTTCLMLGIVPELLADKCRHPTVVLAREIITVLARKYTVYSFPEIAQKMGRPSHTTVFTAMRRHERKGDTLIPRAYPLRTRAWWREHIENKVTGAVRPL